MIEILQRLISFESITPKSSGAIEYIDDLLKSHGFKSEVKLFGPDNNKVTNLYASYGNDSPNICFAGHVDVVPPGNLGLWKSDPFTADINAGKIYGRGAVDMKGALAAALSASIEYLKLKTKFKGTISFLLTSDEEGDAQYGTKQMLQYLNERGEKIDLVILGEPTAENQVGDTIKIGRRGSVNFNLEILGAAGHVAYPELAQNPVKDIVNIIYTLINHKFDSGNEFFQPSNLEITSIDVGNNVTNVIPHSATAKFNIRFNDLHSSETIIEYVKKLIDSFNIEYTLSYKSSASSFIQKPDGYIEEFAKLVYEALVIKPKFSTSGGTSDARFIHQYFPVVEFGLPNKTAHAINEYAEINDLQRLYTMYYYCLGKFLG